MKLVDVSPSAPVCHVQVLRNFQKGVRPKFL